MVMFSCPFVSVVIASLYAMIYQNILAGNKLSDDGRCQQVREPGTRHFRFVFEQITSSFIKSC
jgi:hypothetical protein